MNYPGFVFRILRAEGHAAEALLAGTGLTEDAFVDADARTEFSSLRRFFRNGVEVTGEPHLALRLAQRLDARLIGPAAYAAMTAARFEDALDVLNRFFSLTFTAIEFGFSGDDAEQGGSEAAIRLRPKLELDDVAYFVCSGALVVCDGLLRAILQRDNAATRAETTVAEPEGWADAARHLDFPIRFAAAETKLFFPRSLLDATVPGADPINHPRLVALCEEFEAKSSLKSGPASQVLAFLERQERFDVPLSEVASALGYSERGLRRHLERSNTSFRKLVDDVRERRAREMLASSAAPIQHIAYALGFDTPSNFARSFKRWSGVTPKEFRQSRKNHLCSGR